MRGRAEERPVITFAQLFMRLHPENDQTVSAPRFPRMPDATTTRDVLRLLAGGVPPDRLLHERPGLTLEDVRRAAAEALAALDHPAPESREQRIRRIRETHARAFEPWSEDEDAHLLRRHDEGARLAELSREMLRPPNAVRIRLEKWLGPAWRTRGAAPGAEEGVE